MQENENNGMHKLKLQLYEIIFEADTRAGKIFDIALLILILFSILIVSLESVESLGKEYHSLFVVLEWFITISFSIEYILRLWSAPHTFRYAISFYGIIDLLSLSPTYLAFFLPGTHSLLLIRALRLLRVFRILKLSQFVFEERTMIQSLKRSSIRIFVFMMAVMVIVIICGSLMYLVEGQANGFSSIPQSIYWAIVTITTVGYGDIAPVTPLGKIIAAFMMLIGYAIIAVPTGIITAELVKKTDRQISTQTCPNCFAEGHDSDATFCKDCGAELNPEDDA